ncbi:SDR family NAD(P)-dependent oxidoreductase [Streptomyces sp. NPDC021098]|uniref:SDR family NAD(P)-dependent oxidoreductase n=1 Tax=unclassified Streptomyces TaxID=2593676 RepID=UPI0037AEB5F9
MRFPEKVAIVTGGAGGVGRTLVRKLTHEGAAVMIADVSAEGSGSLAKEVEAAGATVAFEAGDLRERSYCEHVVARTVERFGGVDILINNAGIMFEHSLSRLRVEEWDLMMAVNLGAPLFLAQAALPQMRDRGGGSIVNIGSIEGLGANPGPTAYCASKAGIHGMTRAMAVDLGEDNIRCNAIAPGWITSELSEKYLASHADPDAARDALNRLHPLGRVGRPTDVGDLAVYLAGDGSRSLTGKTVVLDGGRTAKLPMPSS